MKQSDGKQNTGAKGQFLSCEPGFNTKLARRKRERVQTIALEKKNTQGDSG